MTQSPRNKLLVIGGPTASGKTGLAIKLAQHFNTEILSADSRQCYQELNIGVAKPNKEELEIVKHHFISSHSIHDEVTAGNYMRYGLDVLNQQFEKSNTAICVGGTGLYIRALCEGLDEIPPIDLQIKKNIEKEFEEKGLGWLQEETKKVDAIYYEQADAENHMRLLRALIFYKSHHQSIRNFIGREKAERNFDIAYYAISMPREALYARINTRVDNMMKEGLFEEAESLFDFQEIKALQTVGYKELFAHLNGEHSMQKAIDKIKQHTRNYAKRQLTWFKNQGQFKTLTAEAIEASLLNK